MSFFAGKISIIELNGHRYWNFEEAGDFKKILTIACKKYGITTRKKRIRMKYFKKLMNEALRAALKDISEPKS